MRKHALKRLLSILCAGAVAVSMAGCGQSGDTKKEEKEEISMPDYQEPDYKELYLKLFRATEETINRLIEVQQQCEELYLAAGDHETDSPLP